MVRAGIFMVRGGGFMVRGFVHVPGGGTEGVDPWSDRVHSRPEVLDYLDVPPPPGIIGVQRASRQVDVVRQLSMQTVRLRHGCPPCTQHTHTHTLISISNQKQCGITRRRRVMPFSHVPRVSDRWGSPRMREI
jgi:hypothetical protein